VGAGLILRTCGRKKKCMGRLGPAVLHISPGGKRFCPATAAENHHRARNSNRCDQIIRFAWIWAELPKPSNRYPPRHRLDAGAVPKLRVQGKSIFGGLSLPGFFAADRRLPAKYRPGLQRLSPLARGRFFKLAEVRGRRPPTTVSSIATSPVGTLGDGRRRCRLTPTRGKPSGNRSDPFAPLTSQLLPVGDSP